MIKIMNFQIIVCLYICLKCCSGYLLGQEKKGLKIGDKVPNIIITNMTNYPSSQANFADFKGKLVIVDFWNQWCVACIRGMPKMQELKEKFDGKLEVLLVTQQTQKELEPLFRTSPTLKSTTLPFVFSDTIFSQLFPHKANPYHVWIDGNGIVRALTNGWNSTEKSIADFLDGKDPQLNVREDAMDFELGVSLLKEGDGRLIKYMDSYSVFIPHKLKETPKNLLKLFRDSITQEFRGLEFVNYPVVSLYAYAYELPVNSKIMVDDENSADYFKSTDPANNTPLKNETSF